MEDAQPIQPNIDIPVRQAPVQSQDSSVMPPNPLTPVVDPATTIQPPPSSKRNTSSIIIAILSGIIVIGVIAFIFMQYTASRQVTQVTEPTPTAFPTSTPSLQLSEVATTSAFVSFMERVASLSAQVNGFSLQDGALNPPSLESEITFKAQ